MSADSVRFVGGYWFDGEKFEPEQWYARDGRLTRQRPEQIDRQIDLAGLYLLPPFAEAHNHNLQNPFLARRFHDDYVHRGILYGLMMCASPSPDSISLTRQILRERQILDIQLASACISSSDGHPLAMALQPESGSSQAPRPQDLYDTSYIVIDELTQIETKWELVQSSQPDWIKLILVHSEDESRRGNEHFFGINGLKPFLIAPLVEKAHAAGIRVTAHVESAADFEVAVNSGVDMIAHLPGYHWHKGYALSGYRLTDSSIAMAAQKNIAVIATSNVATMFHTHDPDRQQAVRTLQIENLSRLKQAGVPILTGSDNFMGSVLDEIFYLKGAGLFSNLELLQSLSVKTPQQLFPKRRLGQFEEGFEASMVALRANPLNDLRALQEVQKIIKLARDVSPAPRAAP
ncbi:amidohydrolase family protein [Bowmanella dokdonensis]|uniref:Amidohydrolase family protein n=1 Tax=Bowmanella dokdonensis TaxID=751969 RepID=A0A939DS42_9ALTE|nr:amidohydrolase family protein [Bowmanella dokdonensis]